MQALTQAQVGTWLQEQGFSQFVPLFAKHKIDGTVMAMLNETDLCGPLFLSDATVTLGAAKLLHAAIQKYKLDEPRTKSTWKHGARDQISKLIFSIWCLLIVSFMTALMMTIVHERVPDSTKFPPLPDIMLDNIQHISWAFAAVEIIILILGTGFASLIILHKFRWIILRRFCAIASTIFFLRCMTMFVTSLSVPGAHLKCEQRPGSSAEEKLYHAWHIISNFGMHINGVRTCGDYMFSGHTSIVTLFTCFIMEYTPRSWKGLEYGAYMLNVLGMFFVLAAHEHYSIGIFYLVTNIVADVFMAYFIASRMFSYYHTLANTISNKIGHYKKIKAFFMFQYLEEYSDGIVPNEYEVPFLNHKAKKV